MVIKEKPEFVYTGQKDTYKVKWYNTNIPNTIPEEKNGAILFIIVLDDVRINYYNSNPLKVEEYVKKRIEAKGRGADAFGRARVFWRDIKTGKEHLCLIVDKNVHRYYEPVERFKHGREGF